jgi:hypothetical protein
MNYEMVMFEKLALFYNYLVVFVHIVLTEIKLVMPRFHTFNTGTVSVFFIYTGRYTGNFVYVISISFKEITLFN